MNIRKFIRTLLESMDHQCYYIDNEGHYGVPDPDLLVARLQQRGTLVQFFQMHVANLEATKAKAEMEKAGLGSYPYPEGIDAVIRGGEILSDILEKAVLDKLRDKHIVATIKKNALEGGEDLI